VSQETRTPRTDDDASDLHSIDLVELWTIVVQARLLIAVIVTLSVGVSIGYAYSITPQYRTNVLLQLEKREHGLSGVADLGSVWGGYELPTEAEIEIIRSRSVLSPAIDALQMDLNVFPVHHPVFGEAIAEARDEGALVPPFLGLVGYAWGGERIKVDRLELPLELQGRELHLVARGGDAYELQRADGVVLLSGKVGEAAASADRTVRMFVSVLVANPGTPFTVSKSNRIAAINGLGTQLSILERGRSTGIIELSYTGPDPVRIARILDAIATSYLRQDVERRSAEAAKTLEFLQQQLPELKARVEAAETTLAEHRAKVGAVDLTVAGQDLVEAASRTDAELSALQLQQAEMRERFTPSHPAMVALDEKMKRTIAARDRYEAQLRRLPSAEQDSARLLRDLRVATELYVLLLNKSQELSVVKAGTVGDVRIVDPAYVPTAHFKPLKRRIATIGLIIGLVFGVAAAFLRRALDRGIQSPEVLERTVGLAVYAAIPHSDEQRQLDREWERAGRPGSPALAIEAPRSLTMEGIRSLRTALQFALMDAPSNVIAIAGSIPGVGKSFTALNLAHSIAEIGKRVLLIDCDLRRGSLHRAFGLRYEGGLSELLAGTLAFEAALHQRSAQLHFIKSGRFPPNPSEVLMSARFRSLIEDARGRYDVVLLDAPPVLPVTDGVLVAQAAGISFLVVREGKSSARELEEALRRLRQNGVTAKGAIFNDLGRGGHRRYGGYGYGYTYGYTQGAAPTGLRAVWRQLLREFKRLIPR